MNADIIACRCDAPVSEKTKAKIGHFCNVPPSHVMSLHNVSDIWKVPLLLHQQQAVQIVTSTLGMYLPHGKPDLTNWSALVNTLETSTESVDIAIVGKYTGEVSDTYLSVCRALKHAAVRSVRARSARISIISLLHVSIVSLKSQEYYSYRSLIPKNTALKSTFEYELNFDEYLTRASRSNTGTHWVTSYVLGLLSRPRRVII